MFKWYVYGAGGMGLETMDILSDSFNQSGNKDVELLFLVDQPNAPEINGYPIVSWGDCDLNAYVTIAIGEPEIREMLAKKCIDKGLKLKSAVSPKAYVSPSAKLADGVVVAPFASIQSSACLASNVAVNTQACIGHHSNIMEHAVISSQVNLGGNSFVGVKSYLGMGAMVKEQVKIGSGTILGMGSVAYKDIPDSVIAIGNPARPAKRNEDNRVFS
ncbi:acetyltransferase [Alphaproteobacteria bacterium]|nr:acetyltransferase [Alphaproteobacteria bacterium]